MITNEGFTVYNKLSTGTYKRTYVPKVFWRNIRMEEIKKYGADNASSVSVMVFYDQLADYVKPENFTGTVGWTVDTIIETHIVKGNCARTITTDINELYENSHEVYKVVMAIQNFFGDQHMWHLKIEGK